MAIRGRKPKPVVDKIIRGNPGHRSLQTTIPQPHAGEMPCPPSVAKSESAKAIWDHYLATTAPGHLSPVDAPLLASLCTALARKEDAEAKLLGAGMVVRLHLPGQSREEAPRGAFIQNPYLPIANRQQDIARKLAAELALTPAERNRLGIKSGGDGDGGPVDPAEKYFRK